MFGIAARRMAKDAVISYGQEQICDWMGMRSPRTGISLGGAIGEIGYKALHPSPAMRQHRATTRGFSGSVVKDLQKGQLGSLDKLKLKNVE